MTPDAANIFDQKAQLLRQQRAKLRFLQKPDRSPDFLLKYAAEDIAARLSLVSRQFSNAVDVFGRTGALASTMSAVANIDKISRMEAQNFYIDDDRFDIIINQPDLLEPQDARFDLAVSAFALHWSADLPSMLIQIRNIIQPDGLFLGVLAGPDTLNELRQCLATAETEILGGVSPRIDPFTTVQAAGALMQRAGFALPVVDSDKITVRYDTMFELIADLRAMAATNFLQAREKNKFSKTLFTRAADIYASQFADEDGRIRATFELISMSGWVPHPNQQKPSKPGSVAINLADAINQSKKE